MVCCYCLVAIIALLYYLFDVNYFIRVLFTVVLRPYLQRKVKLLEETAIYGFCFLQDVDLVMKHMNNARYLRELDFARMNYLMRSNIFSLLSKMGATVVLGASTTRYRRPIPLFMPYKVTTKLIHWDEKNLYFDHKFLGLRDNFVHAIMITKQSMIGLKMPVGEFLSKIDKDISLPPMTDDLRLWLESMEYSSQKLRKRD